MNKNDTTTSGGTSDKPVEGWAGIPTAGKYAIIVTVAAFAAWIFVAVAG